MIGSYMSKRALEAYVVTNCAAFNNSIKQLDSKWIHSKIVADLLHDAERELRAMTHNAAFAAKAGAVPPRDRKTTKYTEWVEVMRLASFQYERFSQNKRARSEALYSTLLSLACTWGHQCEIERIIVAGCGPGRSVLDFAKTFPLARITGLDYSFLSLLLGQRIVCGNGNVNLLRRDVYSNDNISEILNIPGFNLSNADFALCDLVESEIPACDMIVCSNTLNLLPDHCAVADRMCKALRPGGLLIFADLIGWRLDRKPSRKILRSDDMIRTTFESAGLIVLDWFQGVPYIESESDDQETIYNEHFYVGQKTK